MREVEGSSATEQNSTPISVFTEEIVVIEVLGLKFLLLLTRLPNFSAISTLWWDPRASKKTCALIGVDSPKKDKKKRNACSLLNTSNNVVTKQFILVL